MTSIVKLISIFDYVLEKHSQIVDTTQINFLATINDPQQEPHVSLEHKGLRWVTVEEMETLDKITEETRLSVLNAPLQDSINSSEL